MSKKARILIIFFVVLTASFVTVLSLLNGGEMMKKRYRTVSVVQPFRFTTHNGTTITNDSIDGKVVLVNYFFTTCQSICPPMNNTLKEIYEEFKNEKDFLVISHTSDPDKDSVSVLHKYADSIKAGTNWIFATGNKKDLYYHARKSYTLDDLNKPVANPDIDFIHTQLFALVNKKGQVKKKVYDSAIPEEMEELKADIGKALNGNL